VRAMLFIVPKLNERAINTILLKHLAKSQMDPEFGIRTNTTVLLAKIASYLSQQTRQKIFAAAFSRSLKDPHPKARVAGVLGLEHTMNYYNKEDCASKIIPSIALMLVDPEKECRDNAFRAMKQFLKKMEKISETGVDENAEQAPKSESGMLGWAWGGLSKKIYGEGQQPNQSPVPMTQSGSKGLETTESSPSTPPPQKKKTVQETDGWDNNNDFNDFEEEDSKPSTKKNDDDDFSTSVYSSKKPLNLKTSNSAYGQKKELPKNSSSSSIGEKKASAPVVPKSNSKEDGGWDDAPIDDEEPQIYGSKPKGSSKFEMDEEEEPNGWNDSNWNDNEAEWDFEASSTKSSKLDMAKQKLTQKSVRTGKAD